MERIPVKSGIQALDEVLQDIRLGDNVVWQVDSLNEYIYFARPFVRQALDEGRKVLYMRFAPHPLVLEELPGLVTIEVDPSLGFDSFSSAVHRIIEEHGKKTFYVFDNISTLVEEWATDEQLANFFQVTCPFLFELDTVAYFALLRGQHSFNAIARIRDTTQVLIDVYHANGDMYMHPIKVWNRYSPQMFLPHSISGNRWVPVSQSGKAATVSTAARKQPLRKVAQSIAPWESVYRKLTQYREVGGSISEQTPEIAVLKAELCRMMLGSHKQFNMLANRYFSIDDLLAIRNRLIGSGQIGGKAAGMLLARRILLEKEDTDTVDFAAVLEDHDSFYVGSDVFFSFLVNNDLFRLRLQMSSNSRISRAEFGEVERRFLAGEFPSEIVEQFRDMLDYFGQAPIIVRSSSFLEDSFGNAFAGKYRSEFCPNQGGPEDRLKAFLQAVKLVYASAINPDALAYRRKRGLGESDEQMAVLVQRVSGMPYKHYFFPGLAGVGFSRNLYPWNNRIDPRQGVIRLVFGLGTRAVDRVGGDYPRMIAVSHPELRPEVGPRIAKYSQRIADVLNLKDNTFTSVPVHDLLGDKDYPNLHYLVSVMSDGNLYNPHSIVVEGAPRDLVLTFNNVISRTNFVKIMGCILRKLDKAYDNAVDIEFTAFVDADGNVRINLLQCRPMWFAGSAVAITVPSDVPAEKILFRSSRLIGGGDIANIRYIVYIDPRKYAAIPSEQIKKTLGRVVGAINENEQISKDKVLMMGPGRWGSSNIELGVNVTYADIDNVPILVEMAYEAAGHVPEVSYGTHFFQDLVESGTIYMAVYPDEPNCQFNREFFEKATNVFGEIVPDYGDFSDFIHIIDVPKENGGLYAHVTANATNQTSIAFLEPKVLASNATSV